MYDDSKIQRMLHR